MSLTTQEKKNAACELLKGEEIRKLIWRIGGVNYEGEEGGENSMPQELELKAEKSAATAPSRVDNVQSDKSSPAHPLSAPSLYETSLSGLQTTRTGTSTSVLYASPSLHVSPLHTLCQSLRELFLHANFLIPEPRPLLLHATVFNTLHCTKKPEKGKTIDAKALMEKWEQVEWVRNLKIERVAIWEMGAKFDAEEGGRMYRELAGVDLS